MKRPPAAYVEGYAKARALDPGLADAYVEHAMVGDPLADAAVASLDGFEPAVSHRLIDALMERDEETSGEAPDALREFFASLDQRPPRSSLTRRKPLPAPAASTSTRTCSSSGSSWTR